MDELKQKIRDGDIQAAIATAITAKNQRNSCWLAAGAGSRHQGG